MRLNKILNVTLISCIDMEGVLVTRLEQCLSKTIQR